MRLLFLAAAGGGIGAGARYLVNQAFTVPPISAGVPAFPWSTMTVNIVGGFLMGVVFVLVGERLGGAPEWRIFLATGILGGFTTFSAFSLDAWQLWERGATGLAAGYVAASVVLSVAGLAAGLVAARALLP